MAAGPPLAINCTAIAANSLQLLLDGAMKFLANLAIRDAGNRLVRANVDEAAAWMGSLTSEADRKAARISVYRSGVKGEARNRLFEVLGGE